MFCPLLWRGLSKTMIVPTKMSLVKNPSFEIPEMALMLTSLGQLVQIRNLSDWTGRKLFKSIMNEARYTILLVEDDDNDVLLLQRAFRKAGLTHALQTVSDGEQAVAYLSGEAPFDDREKYPFPTLMLTDLKMPRKSGHEVLAWLRQQEKSEIKNLPVIVLTSSRLTDDVDQAYDLGATSYMAKPSGDFDGLAQMVKNLEAQK